MLRRGDIKMIKEYRNKGMSIREIARKMGTLPKDSTEVFEALIDRLIHTRSELVVEHQLHRGTL